MSLSALPAELKLHIAELLDPTSTLNFALSCKDHSALCKSVLETHGRLLSEWQVIDPTKDPACLWQTLKEILEDPQKGWYVRELNLPGSWTARAQWDENQGPVPSDDQELFKRAARKLGEVYSSPTSKSLNASIIVGTIENRLDEGYEDGIVAILLHHLPYLKTIKLTEDQTECLELTMEVIAEAYKDPIRAPKLPLQHLKTAAVSHSGRDGCGHASWACLFSNVPSLSTFAGFGLGGIQHQTLPEQAAIPHSNVTELFFQNCHFEVEGLGVILAGIKNLRKLTYDGDNFTDEDWNYEAEKVIQIVLKHAGHSLEELVLDQPEEDYYYRGEDETRLSDQESVSLRDFQKLKVLNCSWSMIRPIELRLDYGDEPLEQGYYRKEDHKELDDFDIRTLLPKSLEWLYLHVKCCREDNHDEWQVTETLFTRTNPSTPKLSLEKTCIRMQWGGETMGRIGTAEDPRELDECPLMALCNHEDYW